MRRLARSTRTPIGITADGRHMAAVQLSCAEDGWRLEAATLLDRRRDEAFGVPGADFEPSDVRRLIEVFDRQGFHGSKVVLAVPREKLMLGMLDLPPANPGLPMEQLARVELARLHRCDPQEFEMAHWSVPSRARATEGTQVMAAGCATQDANALLDVLEAEGLDVVALDVPSLAATRACTSLLRKAGEVAAILDLGWDAAALVLVCQGVVVYERILADAAISVLHANLVSKLGLEPTVADYLLDHVGLDDQASRERGIGGAGSDAERIITSHLDGMAAEVRVSCSYLMHRHASTPPETLLLMGAGAAMPGLAARLSEQLSMRAQVIAPMNLAECPAHLNSICGNPAITAAMGLAQHTSP